MGDLKRIVSAVNVQADEFQFGIISGSLTFKDGFPERTVKGLDNGSTTWSENQESAIGMVKFDIPTTVENVKSAQTLAGRTGSTIKFYDENGFERVMKTGILKNDGEFSISNDGKRTLTFEGTPMM